MAQEQRSVFLLQLWIFFTSIAFLLFSTDMCSAQAKPAILQRGQVIVLQFTEGLDSKTAHPGDKVPLKLTRDLTAGSVVVLPKGTLVYGRVTADHPARDVCHNGRVEWKLNPIVLANGQKIRAEYISQPPSPSNSYQVPCLRPATKLRSGSQMSSFSHPQRPFTDTCC